MDGAGVATVPWPSHNYCSYQKVLLGIEPSLFIAAA